MTMTDPVSEPVHETTDDLWADDELSDEALDRAAIEGLRASGSGSALPPTNACACARCYTSRGGSSS